MKRYATLGVGLLAVVVALGLMAMPADARTHRHHRHHRRGGGGGGAPVCTNPITVLPCVTSTPPPPPPPPPLAGSLTLSPSNTTLIVTNAATGGGNFSLSGLAHYISGGVTGNVTASGTTPGCNVVVAPAGPVTTDLNGNFGFTVTGNGAGAGCPRGVYSITFAPTTAAFQAATGAYSVS